MGLRLYGGKALPRDLVGRRGDGAARCRPGALVRLARADASYASASDPRVLIALGERAAKLGAVDVEVKWPGGKREVFAAVPLGRYTTLTRGEGSAKP